MAIGTSEGAKIYIGAAPTTATTVSALAGLTYTEIKGVESLGELGPQGQDVTFTPLAGPAVQHLKGATDNGATVINCARDPLDPGQIAVAAAAATKFEYPFKIVLADGADGNDPDTTIYVRGPVMGGRKTIGGANDVTKVAYTVGNNVFLEVPSTAVA